MSASSVTTRLPMSAKAAAKLEVVVVFPTPPLPEVIVTIVPAITDAYFLRLWF